MASQLLGDTGVLLAVGRLMMRLVPLVPLFGGACGDPGFAPDAGATDAGGMPPQGGLPWSALVINEVAPKVADGPDWFEIFNRGEDDLDLCLVLATDDVSRLDHYHPLGGTPPPEDCAPRLLGAGDYLVVYADDGASREMTMDSAPFKLGEADGLHLLSWSGEPLDGLDYLFAGPSGQSLSRTPNGEGLFVLTEATAGRANAPLPEEAP